MNAATLRDFYLFQLHVTRVYCRSAARDQAFLHLGDLGLHHENLNFPRERHGGRPRSARDGETRSRAR